MPIPFFDSLAPDVSPFEIESATAEDPDYAESAWSEFVAEYEGGDE